MSPKRRPPVARASEGRSVRAKLKRIVGTVKSFRVRGNTRKRYTTAYARFFWHVSYFALPLDSCFDLDSAACHYLEHLWQEGEPRLWVGDALAAIHYYIPSAKRQLPVCWSLHRA